MINTQEKSSIVEKIHVLAKFSNIIIKLADKDGGAYDVAIILQGMFKDMLVWLDEMPTIKPKHGMKYRTRAMMLSASENGEDPDDEEEDDYPPKLSQAQIAAKNFVNGGMSLSEARDQTYGPGRGRKPGSKNKPK